jgi:predicted Zn finger-like uncharacterized protein
MIVTCPACSTRYNVNPRALGAAGRVVRCANCGNTWHQAPPADLPRSVDRPPPASAAAAPRPMAVPMQAEPLRRRRIGVAVGWAIFLLVLVGLAVGGVTARERIVERWPPAAKLYSMLGLAVEAPGAGLELRKVTPSRTVEDGKPALVIAGEIANVSNVARDVPKLKVVLRDKDEHVLQTWSITATEERLLPGASVPFRTTVASPSEAATGVVVTFADGS